MDILPQIYWDQSTVYPEHLIEQELFLLNRMSIYGEVESQFLWGFRKLEFDKNTMNEMILQLPNGNIFHYSTQTGNTNVEIDFLSKEHGDIYLGVDCNENRRDPRIENSKIRIRKWDIKLHEKKKSDSRIFYIKIKDTKNPDYIPPFLNINSTLGRILEQIKNKIDKSIDKTLRLDDDNNKRRLILQSLYRCLTMISRRNVHPRIMYFNLVQFLGDLTAINLKTFESSLYKYNHEDIHKTFKELSKCIETELYPILDTCELDFSVLDDSGDTSWLKCSFKGVEQTTGVNYMISLPVDCELTKVCSLYLYTNRRTSGAYYQKGVSYNKLKIQDKNKNIFELKQEGDLWNDDEYGVLSTREIVIGIKNLANEQQQLQRVKFIITL